MNWIRKLFALGVVSMVSVPLPAQQTTNPPRATQQTLQATGQQPGTIVMRSGLVVVPVTVKDGSGELVSDLQESDFRILDDGVEQRISLFSADPAEAVYRRRTLSRVKMLLGIAPPSKRGRGPNRPLRKLLKAREVTLWPSTSCW